MANKIIWTPTERQARFLECPADEALYGGSAGGGKSDALLVWSMGDPLQNAFNNPNWKSLILRRTFPDLERTLIHRSRFFFSDKGKYDANKFRWTFPGGGLIQFGHMKNENDKYNYKSAEYNRIGFDEVTEFSETMYLYMFSRNRTTDKRIIPQIRCASNPGGIGHGWVKNRFITAADGSPRKEDHIYTLRLQLPHNQTKTITRCFIPAKLKDNPYLYESDPQYLARLEMLPDIEKRALRDGDWDIYSGQFFTDFTEQHICEAFDFPLGWPVWLSMDWGFATKCAVCFFTQDPKTGVIYLFDEVYVSRMSAQNVARLILEKLGRRFLDVVGRYSDRRINLSEERVDGISTWQKFADEGLYFTIANDDRVSGWHRTRELFMLDNSRQVKFQVFDHCRFFIEKIANCVHDMNKPEDMDHRGETHIADALRYFAIMRRFVESNDEEFQTIALNPKTGYPGQMEERNDLLLHMRRLTHLKPGVDYVFHGSQLGTVRSG